ncbi:hypothetical protein AML91_14385 [Paenibacillus jilunlii]|uniref:Uncharacterized protein n=1 Tax=Paenibacillus jilunlii TaxID=682956 RepID=A0ABR5SU53_9BACL|nr:hypothetical protein AML91_14385 [Paenibacillus jilunlii]
MNLHALIMLYGQQLTTLHRPIAIGTLLQEHGNIWFTVAFVRKILITFQRKRYALKLSSLPSMEQAIQHPEWNLKYRPQVCSGRSILLKRWHR